MRRNTKKFKPNPSKVSRHSIRSSSIRDIIGDRRFNQQFSHVNPHGIEGIKKVKRMKVGDDEADDHPNLGQNASSSKCEPAEDPRRFCGDFAAKTSEYAFFKKMKQNTSSNTHVHPKYDDNQVNIVQKSDHSTRKETPNVQKQSTKYPKAPLPNEKEQDDAHYSFLSPPFCGLNNGHEANNTNAIKFTPQEYHRSKTSENKGVFAMKREKLSRRVAEMSLYDSNELSLKGIDLVSALISRILPENQNKNCKDESKKGHEANKTRLIESCHLNDDFPISLERTLEWNQNCSESSFTNHSEAYKRKWNPNGSDLVEWNPNYSDFTKTCFQYDDYHSEDDKRKWKESCYISSYLENGIPRSLEWNPPTDFYHSEDGFRIPNLGIESGYFKEIENEALLLGWEKDEIETFSATESEAFTTTTITSSPRVASSSIVPYTPKHVISSENSSSIEKYGWCLNECLNEKEEAFVFLLESRVENENNFDDIGYPL